MTFKFAMQSVLHHREHQQREAEIALGRAMVRLGHLETERIVLTQELNSMVRDRPTQAGFLAHFAEYSMQLKKRMVLKDKEIEAQKLQVEKARLALAECARDRKAMEIVRDKQKQAHDLGLKRQEAKHTDETATQRFLRAEREVPS